MIMNHTITLESFIDNDVDFIVGEDWNGLNSGVFFIRVCPETLRFMRYSFDYVPTDSDRQNTPYWWWSSEQCAYTRCLHTVKHKLVHHHLFNGYALRMHTTNDFRHQIGDVDFQPRYFQKGDFILHLVAGDISFKLWVLHQYIDKVIK